MNKLDITKLMGTVFLFLVVLAFAILAFLVWTWIEYRMFQKHIDKVKQEADKLMQELSERYKNEVKKSYKEMEGKD